MGRTRPQALHNLPTPEYKRRRRIWWVCLSGAIATTALSLVRQGEGVVGYIMLGFAHAFIIVALYLDSSKIRKAHRIY